MIFYGCFAFFAVLGLLLVWAAGGTDSNKPVCAPKTPYPVVDEGSPYAAPEAEVLCPLKPYQHCLTNLRKAHASGKLPCVENIEAVAWASSDLEVERRQMRRYYAGVEATGEIKCLTNPYEAAMMIL